MKETPAKPVVWITGAAGGLGRALVEAFAAGGWRTVAAYHTHPVPFQSPDVWPLPLDVTRPGDPERLVQELAERWGRLDALVNNAGVTADSVLPLLKESDWDRTLAVNLTGAARCSRAALHLLGEGNGGSIVNIGSYAGRAGAAGQAAYAAAKAGLIGLSQALAAEGAPLNVRVNVVLPGILATRMTARLPAGAWDRLVNCNLLRRPNRVEEVARFVVFLCSLNNVSGQVFQLDSRPARWA